MSTLREMQQWRIGVGSATVLILGVGGAAALHWIWQDITDWSRSQTVAYQSESLERCVRLVALDLPGATVSATDKGFELRLPQRDAISINATPTPQLASVVVHGHSASISHLGPASEEAATALLGQLSGEFKQWCGSP